MRTYRTYRLATGSLCTLALLLGALQAWHTRHRIFSDGISYLEIAGKYAGGNWKDALNAYWSPLYSWILAGALVLLRPSDYWQVATLHLVNFLAYGAGLLALSWLLREASVHLEESARFTLYLGGYASYMLAGLYFIGIGYCSPDMIAFGLTLALSALILRIQRKGGTLPHFALAGLLLGLAYMARTAFAPLALLYLAVLWVVLRKQKKPWLLPVSCLGAVFLLCAGPFVMALSLKQGHFTLGESGKLNYAWEIDGVARSIHWQGEPEDFGKPVHPTTPVAKNPDAYVFDGPGTYSPWYDPALWYSGIQPKLKPAMQARVFLSNLGYSTLLLCFSPILIPVLLLVIGSGQLRQFFRHFLYFWPIIVPCLAGMGVYCFVFVDRRYIAGFLLIIWTAVLASVSPATLRFSRLGTAALHSLCVVFLVAFTINRFREPARVALQDLSQMRETEPNLNYLLAQRFQQLGLMPGDKIAYVGLAINADWTRLDKVRIVSEVPVRYLRMNNMRGSFLETDPSEIGKFWHADPGTRAKILNAFRDAGAKVVVADGLYYPKEGTEWEPVLTAEQRRIHFGSGQYPDQAESRFCRLVPNTPGQRTLKENMNSLSARRREPEL